PRGAHRANAARALSLWAETPGGSGEDQTRDTRAEKGAGRLLFALTRRGRLGKVFRGPGFGRPLLEAEQIDFFAARADAFRTHDAHLFEDRFPELDRFRKIGAHEDLTHERGSAGFAVMKSDIERPLEQLKAHRLVAELHPARARSHIRQDHVVGRK